MKKARRKIYKILSLFSLICVMVIIFILSHQDGTQSSYASSFITKVLSVLFSENISEGVVRTLGHFSEFAVLGFLVFNCIYAFNSVKKPLISVLTSWIYAWTDEIHQLFIPERAFQFSDLAVDLLGIIIGVVFILCLTLIYEKQHKTEKH